MSRTAVTKMHGTFNDFVVIDGRDLHFPDLPALARSLCDRHGGIGADGLIVLESSPRAHARMRIANADGSEAEMCGNGMRCVIRFLSERGEGDRFSIETLAGTITGEVLEKGREYVVRISAGIPVFEMRALPVTDAVYVALGNPHVVIFAEHANDVDLPRAAVLLPDANVHAVRVESAHRLDAIPYERGVGFTQSCGTGAVACAAAAMHAKGVESPVDVRVPGGVLRVEWDGEGEAFLTGPATRVFETFVDVADAIPA